MLASASSAWGAAPSHSVSAGLLLEQHLRQGQSVGSPTDGHLIGGSRLEDAPYLRILPMYAGDEARWGLGSLVALVDRAARAVRHKFPDAVLSVGHLSRRGGGDIDRHASHESGRDADLSFYIRDQAHHPLYSDHMVSFRGDGTAPTWPGAFFDDARNWALVSAIAEEDHARVTYIFVAAPLRARLLAYAARSGASVAIRNRAAELMVQPRGSLPHDDHFHVRIGCPAGMNACIELPTHARVAHVVARRRSPAPPLASNKERAPATSAVAKHMPSHAVEPAGRKVHPADPPAPQPEEVTPPAAPAVLAAPFDDVDGPVEARPGRGSTEIR
jgi:penicillin-insensitive murein endopeptidase